MFFFPTDSFTVTQFAQNLTVVATTQPISI